ncbi:MAG: hypothetical protein NT077_01255 [Candidatus Taylorbacteria bacterium]|nr:hypothetical protein [Candidatus Taylorbacteria bacterium]
MKTTYKPSVLSPYQMLERKSLDVQNEEHPAYVAIRQCVGEYALKIAVEQDMQTVETLKHIPGVIAFIATISKDGKVIGQGRGAATLGKSSKYVEKSIRMAFNACLIDGIVRSTKMLDAMSLGTSPIGDIPVMNNAPQADMSEAATITDKQKGFLRILVIDNLSREQASDAIKSMQK